MHRGDNTRAHDKRADEREAEGHDREQDRPALAAQARVTGRVVRLPAQDAVAVERLLAQLREQGIAIEDIEIRKADLEDVFLDLMSGHQEASA